MAPFGSESDSERIKGVWKSLHRGGGKVFFFSLLLYLFIGGLFRHGHIPFGMELVEMSVWGFGVDKGESPYGLNGVFFHLKKVVLLQQ